MTGSNPDASQQVSATNTQPVGGVLTPFPYELWSDGIYKAGPDAVPAPVPDLNTALPLFCYTGRKRVSYRPIWISARGHTVDTNEPLLQLSFVTLDGNTVSVWLNRGQITDHNKLAALGADGLPVDSVNNKDLLIYLRAQEALNAPTMTPIRVGHRSGPYILDEQMGWLIGRRWIGPGTLASDPRSNQRYVNAFSPHGDPQAWLDKWRELRNTGWVPRFLIAATFAPPLLRYVQCRTFIVHHWGDSSHGKTATAMFALSAWGNPELLYSSLNRTAISLTEVFKHYTDLPVLYDEKQVSTVTPEEVIYSICTGSGRERGHKDGGLRQDKPTWLTIARTTGEVPLITDGDVGGQFNRVLQIHSVAFSDRRQAESIYPFVQTCHGHAGPMFLEELAALVNIPQGYAFVQRLFKELREALVNRVGLDTNHSAYGAVIATAQTLSEMWLLGIDANEAKEQALDDATEALRETAPKKQMSYAEKALSKLRDHWVANPFLYADDTSAEGREKSARLMRMVGVETDWGMALIPHEANDILIKAGYAPERVWRDFYNRGWLVTEGEGALTTINLRGGRSPEHPVYFIKREVFCTDVVRQTKLQLISGGIQ